MLVVNNNLFLFPAAGYTRLCTRDDDPKYKYRNFALKRCLGTFFRNDAIRRTLQPIIQENANAITKNIWYFSRHFLLECLDNRDDIDYFMRLHQNANSIREKFRDFKRLGNVGILQGQNVPSLRGLSELANTAVRQYAVNLETNLETHMDKRFALYYRFIDNRRMPFRDAIEFVEGLRAGTTRDATWDVLIGGVVRNLAWQLNTSNFLVIPHLFTINDFIRETQMLLQGLRLKMPPGLRTFTVIPKTSFERHHVSYDSNSVIRLKNAMLREQIRLNEIPHNTPLANANDDKAVLWSSLFRTEDYRKEDELGAKTQGFALSINTDGIAVSIYIRKRIVPKVQHEQFAQRAGIDPGYRYMYGAVFFDEATLQRERNLLLKASQHRHNAGNPSRVIRRGMITGAIDAVVVEDFADRLEEIHDRYEDDATLPVQYERDMINVELGHALQKFDVYQKNTVTRIKFNGWWQRRKTIDQEVAAMVPRDGPLLMCYGNGIQSQAVIRR